MSNIIIKKINGYIDYDRVRYILQNSSKDVIVEFKNTLDIAYPEFERLERLNKNNRVKIRIAGPYTDEVIRKFPVNEDHACNDNIYELSEVRQIMRALINIEEGVNPNWSDEQKLIYFIGVLKNRIIYHPFHETAPSSEIRSLRGLITKNTVCAGYALMLKELCDRNKIECYYVLGSTNEEEAKMNYASHAWNIVKINGNLFPIDLTWMAGAHVRGRSRSISDIANVNEFINSHFPCKEEAIQDYKNNLKSIDGTYLLILHNLINKDTVYSLNTYEFKRNDGTKFQITQVGENVIEGNFVYKYIYNKINDDGTLGSPTILYSSTNIALHMSKVEYKNKLELQLASARKDGDFAKVNELVKQLQGSEYLSEASDFIKERLFSFKNLNACLQRGDYYVGKYEFNEERGKGTSRVLVDPSIGKEIGSEQKTYRRRDGTYFVLEKFGTLEEAGNIVYRYVMFENITENNGEKIIQKNTIFTDVDVFLDNRQLLVDDFFDRKRIDRKIKEASGYLGYYSENYVRTYVPQTNIAFHRDLYLSYRMNPSFVRSFKEKITFEEMKKLVKIYEMDYVDGNIVAVNRQTRRVIKDEDLTLKINFACMWLQAAGVKVYGDDPVYGFRYAYEVDGAAEVFCEIAATIDSSIKDFGNIDTIGILNEIDENCTYKYAKDIVISLFKHPYNLGVIDKLFRQQNPSAIMASSDPIPFYSDSNAYTLLAARKKELLAQKKQIMEVVKRHGQIEFKQYRGK